MNKYTVFLLILATLVVLHFDVCWPVSAVLTEISHYLSTKTVLIFLGFRQAIKTCYSAHRGDVLDFTWCLVEEPEQADCGWFLLVILLLFLRIACVGLVLYMELLLARSMIRWILDTFSHFCRASNGALTKLCTYFDNGRAAIRDLEAAKQLRDFGYEVSISWKKLIWPLLPSRQCIAYFLMSRFTCFFWEVCRIVAQIASWLRWPALIFGFVEFNRWYERTTIPENWQTRFRNGLDIILLVLVMLLFAWTFRGPGRGLCLGAPLPDPVRHLEMQDLPQDGKRPDGSAVSSAKVRTPSVEDTDQEDNAELEDPQNPRPPFQNQQHPAYRQVQWYPMPVVGTEDRMAFVARGGQLCIQPVNFRAIEHPPGPRKTMDELVNAMSRLTLDIRAPLVREGEPTSMLQQKRTFRSNAAAKRAIAENTLRQARVHSSLVSAALGRSVGAQTIAPVTASTATQTAMPAAASKATQTGASTTVSTATQMDFPPATGNVSPTDRSSSRSHALSWISAESSSSYDGASPNGVQILSVRQGPDNASPQPQSINGTPPLSHGSDESPDDNDSPREIQFPGAQQRLPEPDPPNIAGVHVLREFPSGVLQNNPHSHDPFITLGATQKDDGSDPPSPNNLTHSSKPSTQPGSPAATTADEAQNGDGTSSPGGGDASTANGSNTNGECEGS